MRLNEITMVISTSSKYHDILDGILYSLDKNWIGSIPKIIISSNSSDLPKYQSSRLDYRLDFTFEEWSDRIFAATSSVKTKYLFIVMEDYWLTDSFFQDNICNHINFIEENNVDILYIGPLDRNQKLNSEYEIVANNQDYSINLQAGIWKRDTLINMLRKKESPWEFEINGSFRNKFTSNRIYRAFNGLYVHPIGGVITDGVINYPNLVERIERDSKLKFERTVRVVSKTITKDKTIKRFINAIKRRLKLITNIHFNKFQTK